MNTCTAKNNKITIQTKKKQQQNNDTDQTKIYQIPHKNSKSEGLQYQFICQSPHAHLPATRTASLKDFNISSSVNPPTPTSRPQEQPVWMSWISLYLSMPPPPPPTRTATVQMSSISVHLSTPPPPLNTHIQFKRQLNTHSHNKSANVQNSHLISHHICRPSHRRRQAISRTECMLYFTDNYNINNNHNNKCICKMLNLSMLPVWGSKHYTWNTTTAHDLI